MRGDRIQNKQRRFEVKSKRLVIIAVVGCLALLAMALPFGGGCAPKAQPGQELKVGLLICYTGPAAEKGNPMGNAKLDAWRYINDELGGVQGYKVNPIWYDTEYDATKVVTFLKKLMDDKVLLWTTNSSKEGAAAKENANRAGFPGIVSFSSPVVVHPPEHVYAQMADYGDDWAAFANYYMKDMWKGTGKPKMALHLLNNPTGYGARDAARALADGMGIEIVATEEHAATTTSEMESLTRIKAKNPDVLFISSTPAPTAVIIKNAKDLGMYPAIPIACAHASFTKALVDIAGAAVVEGVYGVFPTVKWGDDVPAMAKMTEYCNKYHPANYGNMDYITSWAETLIVAEVLKNAIKNAGYEVLAKGDAESWQAVETKGIQKLKNFDAGGLHGPVSYTPGDNRLSHAVRVFQVKNGEITPITSWIDAPVVRYEDLSWFGK
jgi:branched-chain amino acid transport system substrate-binding protein